MIAVIGEMAVSFRKNGDGWSRSFSGLGYEWAARLRENGSDALLLTVLPSGGIGKEMADELVRCGIVFDPDMQRPLNPLVEIDGEWLMKGSSPVSLSTEQLTDAFSYFSDIKAVVISSALLSYNPSASSILDAVSFMFPQPKVVIDTSLPEGEKGQDELLKKTLDSFSSSVANLLITDKQDEILSFVRL